MEEQETLAFIAMDLTAAFDTMDYTTLIDVLNITFGIEGKALEWFNSYLGPRHCKTNVEGAYSDPRELAYSVPQGSCAGLVLYSVYTSTIQEVVPQEQ